MTRPGRKSAKIADAPASRRRAGGRRLQSLALAGVSVAIAALGAAALYVEVRPYFVSGLSIQSRIEALTERDLSPGLSFASHRLVLDDCFAAMHSLEARAAPEPVWMALLNRCDRLSSEIVGAAPTNGYGWLVAAAAAGFRSDDTAFAQRLERSRVVAPNEGWLAVERIKLAERAGTAAPYQSALDLAVFLDAGLRDPDILRRYADDRVFRERVNAVLPTRPAEVQRRFLAIVRAGMEG